MWELMSGWVGCVLWKSTVSKRRRWRYAWELKEQEKKRRQQMRLMAIISVVHGRYCWTNSNHFIKKKGWISHHWNKYMGIFVSMWNLHALSIYVCSGHAHSDRQSHPSSYQLRSLGTTPGDLALVTGGLTRTCQLPWDGRAKHQSPRLVRAGLPVPSTNAQKCSKLPKRGLSAQMLLVWILIPSHPSGIGQSL